MSLCHPAQCSDGEVAAVAFRAQPDDDLPSRRVDTMHESHLAAALGDIALIDTEEINPDIDPLADPSASPQLCQGCKEIERYSEGDAIDSDGTSRLLSAPDIGQSHIISPLIPPGQIAIGIGVGQLDT